MIYLEAAAQKKLLPLFHDTLTPEGGRLDLEATRIAELGRELQSTRESHQATVEELESSREEPQSLNEELRTVNAELQSKVEELSAVHDDMRARRFTPGATAIINLIQSDMGRPLQHVDVFNAHHRLPGWTDLAAKRKGVLEKGKTFEICPGNPSSSKEKGAYRIMGHQIIRIDDDWPHRILLWFAKNG